MSRVVITGLIGLLGILPSCKEGDNKQAEIEKLMLEREKYRLENAELHIKITQQQQMERKLVQEHKKLTVQCSNLKESNQKLDSSMKVLLSENTNLSVTSNKQGKQIKGMIAVLQSFDPVVINDAIDFEGENAKLKEQVEDLTAELEKLKQKKKKK